MQCLRLSSDEKGDRGLFRILLKINVSNVIVRIVTKQRTEPACKMKKILISSSKVNITFLYIAFVSAVVDDDDDDDDDGGLFLVCL